MMGSTHPIGEEMGKFRNAPVHKRIREWKTSIGWNKDVGFRASKIS